MKNKHVLIVGAGPTGLTAGLELQRRGIDATVIDKRDQASSLSRAVGILPLSLKLLEPSGVTPNLISEGMKFSFARMYDKTSLLLDLPLKPTETKFGYDFIMGLAQDRTENIIYDRLIELGGKVRYSTEFKSLNDQSEYVDVEFASGKSERYDFVIGADGINSAVRQQLGIEFPGIDLPETWSIADVDATDWLNEDAFTVCMLDDGKVAVVAPLEPNRFRVISNTPTALQSMPLPLNVTNIRREGEFNISIRQVDQYQKGNVFLTGDAAHCHSPVGGRGMNLGIADATELARLIAEGNQDRYHANRHAEGKRIIGGSERIRKFMTAPSAAKKGVFKSALRAAQYVPFFRQFIAQNLLYG